MILVIYAHPYPKHSQTCQTLIDAISDLPGLEVRSLYDRYPDFDIDVAAEQVALTRADLIVWLHPFYWYSVPAMLKHWFDVVLMRGWAYGQGGTALHGKQCLWVTTTGGDTESYSASEMHRRPLADYAAPLEQTAHFCGMHWQNPIVIHGARQLHYDELQQRAQALRERLLAWEASQHAD